MKCNLSFYAVVSGLRLPLPDSLVYSPMIKRAVNEFFLRTLMHSKTTEKVKRRE